MLVVAVLGVVLFLALRDDWNRGEVLCVRTSTGRLSVVVLNEKFTIVGKEPR